MSSTRARSLFPIAALALLSATAPAQPPALTADQIVEQMQRHNQAQAAALQHYEATRHYAVEYHGFGRTLTANMEVEVNYNASSGKTFRILSTTGSKLLIDKVLKRAVESEEEAARNSAATAMTPANYKFRLEKTEDLDLHQAYVLNVEPLTSNKFLYRGRIWVDATDFAVEKIEAQPAKNPSFWISRTNISYTNAKVHGFWLPERNRSETKVRIGGTAVLTIDYGTYQIVPDTLSVNASLPNR